MTFRFFFLLALFCICACTSKRPDNELEQSLIGKWYDTNLRRDAFYLEKDGKFEDPKFVFLDVTQEWEADGKLLSLSYKFPMPENMPIWKKFLFFVSGRYQQKFTIEHFQKDSLVLVPLKRSRRDTLTGDTSFLVRFK